MRANSAYRSDSPVENVNARAAGITETATRVRNAQSRPTVAELERNARVEQHLPLVRRVLERIRRTLPRHIDADDLYSAGVTGLIAASERFDPKQHATFPGYACLRIRGAILDELRRLDWCPRRTRAKARRFEAAVQEAEQELGRAPTDGEMSRRLGVPLRSISKWREAAKPTRFIPLDQPSHSDDPQSGSLHEVIADERQVGVRDSMENEELMQLMADRIEALPEAQKKILAMYYFEGMRLAEIATVFKRTESRISQIHAQAVSTLRAEIFAARNR